MIRNDCAISRTDCDRLIRGMAQQANSPSYYSVYCCNEGLVCAKIKSNELIVYYNVRECYRGRDEPLLPVAFNNELHFIVV